jgi:hypothetical protein
MKNNLKDLETWKSSSPGLPLATKIFPHTPPELGTAEQLRSTQTPNVDIGIINLLPERRDVEELPLSL